MISILFIGLVSFTACKKDTTPAKTQNGISSAAPPCTDPPNSIDRSHTPRGRP